MEEQKKGGNWTAIWSIVLLVVAGLSYGVFKYVSKDQSAVQTPITDTIVTPITPTSTPTPTVTPPVTSGVLYKDGTYSTTGNYNSPGGAEQIAVTVTLKDDIITDATVVSKAFRDETIKFQGKFISGYKTYVIGKNIGSVSLTRVSGSSLTPIGWNDAITKIEAQAKA